MLTKTRFLSGCQCPLRLWLEVHRADLVPPLDPAVEERLHQGNEVGALARTLHPGGVHVGPAGDDSSALVESTEAVVADPGTCAVFEGAFEHDGVLIRADVLLRDAAGRWELHEVKASTRTKEEHLLDVAVQVHVLKGVGIPPERAGILHLDRDYVLGPGGLDPSALLRFADLTAEIDAIADEVATRVAALQDVVEQDEPPATDPGSQCSSPRDCPFQHRCIAGPGPFDLSQLPRAGRQIRELTTLGIDDIREIPADFPLTALQERVRASVVSGEEYVGPGLGAALDDVRWPLLLLDFETFMPAIPRHVGTRPYRQLPVQWSLHLLQRDGSLGHQEFIHDADGDPREPFARSLLEALGEEGSIVVYSSFEASVIRQLAEDLAHLSDELLALLPRLHDLLKVVKDHFYHPEFRGSFSIKAVLPALVPDLGYSDLEIQGGATAAALYRRMIDADTSPRERARIRRDLLLYCERDTLAMVRVRQALRARVG